MAHEVPANLTTMTDLMNYADRVSGHKFYILIPVSLYLVVFFYLKSKNYYTTDCLIAAGFITSVVTAFLLFLGVVDVFVFFLTLSLVGVATLVGMWRGRDGY